TVEGANILTRSMMIFGQGAIRCHPFVLKELEALKIDDDVERLKAFDKLLIGHVGHSISCASRSFVLGLSMARFAAVPGDRQTKKYYRKLSRYTAAFALMADIAMSTYGGKLKIKEKISGRLADALSWLYISAAMLRRFEYEGRPAADQPIMAWAFHDGIYRIQEALKGVIDNYPIAPLRPVLRRIVFPLGANERRPNDRLGHKVAALMLSPSETRDRLTRGCYKADRPGHVPGNMETLLPDVIKAEPLERRLLKAVRAGKVSGYTFDAQVASGVEAGVFNAQEAELLTSVRERVMEIVAVDDFDLRELQAGLTEESEQVRDAA
ncbi:MAG: acyl-CoA dehydrogenase domain-containing protein, partial [Wenzhouxiangellaceae bacterium]|nr:acyl-CoA dehydrogenase domain-containing protein [Wenzhouxiangellaceae bacterium]